jgi:hypothetical protein
MDYNTLSGLKMFLSVFIVPEGSAERFERVLDQERALTIPR